MNSLILEDFNSEGSVVWEGNLIRSRGAFPDGRPSALFSGKIECGNIRRDWSGYGSLQFTLHNPWDRIATGGVEIYDGTSVQSPDLEYGDYIDRKKSILIGEGVTHVIIQLDKLKTNRGDRFLELKNIVRISINAAQPTKGESSISISGLRLCSEPDKPDREANALPGDSILYLKDMDIKCYTYKPDEYEEPEYVKKMYQEALSKYNRLEKLVKVAEINGKQAYYARAALIASDIAMISRPMLAWHFSPQAKIRNLHDAISVMNKEIKYLEDIISSRTHEDDEDDSNLPMSLVKPIPELKQLRVNGDRVVDEEGKPVLLCAMNYINEGELLLFFAPERHKLEVYAAAGGTRYDIEWSPVYEAFKKCKDTERVGWKGWCGHLVKDQWAMGGRKENVVICLENPEILKAIKKYVLLHAHEWKNNSELLYITIGYELSYICYCNESLRMFRAWLKKRHGDISVLNSKWDTSYNSFSEVEPPPTEGMGPVHDANRAAWFDWSDWNMRRFTDHLLWSKDLVRSIHSTIPVCAGGTFSMLSPSVGTSGIDEEMIINEVDDVILHEGNDVLGIDLFRAFSEKAKPVVDPEQGGGCSGWFLNYLHGKSTIAMFWWPRQPSRQFVGSTLAAPVQGNMSIKHVAEHLHTAIDIRRLTEEITAFWDIPKEAAILYSRTSMIQIDSKLVTAEKTPYLKALRDSYDAARYLDTGITFISEKQLLQGKASRYKLLIIPAVSNIPKNVFEAVDEYICEGGTVLITPESFIRDEYNRPMDYLNRWGISIMNTEIPEMQIKGELEQKYDQNFQRKVSGGDGKKIVAAMMNGSNVHKLNISGLYQRIEVNEGKIMAEGPNGETVLVHIGRGKGTIWYMCGTPEKESLSVVIDELFENSGMRRKMKVTDSEGKRIFGIEARFVRRKFDDLVYIANESGHDADFCIETDRKYCEIRELRSSEYYDGPYGKIGKGCVMIFLMKINPVDLF